PVSVHLVCREPGVVRGGDVHEPARGGQDAAAAPGRAGQGDAGHGQAVPQRRAGVLGDWQERGRARAAEGARAGLHVPDHAERDAAGPVCADQGRAVLDGGRAAARRAAAQHPAQRGGGRGVRRGGGGAGLAVLPREDAHAVGVQVCGGRAPAQLPGHGGRAAVDLARGRGARAVPRRGRGDAARGGRLVGAAGDVRPAQGERGARAGAPRAHGRQHRDAPPRQHGHGALRVRGHEPVRRRQHPHVQPEERRGRRRHPVPQHRALPVQDRRHRGLLLAVQGLPGALFAPGAAHRPHVCLFGADQGAGRPARV
ncbi:hypothetical protein IWQ56_007366, partial [Coemansia nantahalensis]